MKEKVSVIVQFATDFFYRNRSVAVLGSGNYAISETNELINIADNITILTNGKEAPEFRADNVKVDTKEIEEIDGEDKSRRSKIQRWNYNKNRWKYL